MGNHRKARFSFLSRVRPPSRQLSGDLIETPGSDVSAADFIYFICYILCMDIQKCISWYVTCYIHVSMYYQICCACVFIYIYILYHNMSYICIYVIQHIHGYIWIYPCMACVDVDDIIIQVQNAWNYVPELKNASVSTVFTWMHIQSGQRYAWCIVSTQ